MTPTWCCPGSLAVSTEAGRSPLLGQLSWGTDAGDSRGLGNNSQRVIASFMSSVEGYLSGFSVKHGKEPVCERLKCGHKISRVNMKRIYSQGLPINVF